MQTSMQFLLVPLVLAVSLTLPGLASAQAKTALEQPTNLVQSTQTFKPLTLNTALERALQSSRDIAASVREVEALDGALRQAGIIPNPELATLIEDRQKATRTTTIQINQPIELGGKRSARITLASRNRDLAVVELAIKRADIRAATITAFYDVLSAQERQRLAQSSVELAQLASSAASKRVTAGKISPIDETKAKVAESTVRIELVQAASELDNARKKLAALWGSSTPDFEQIEGQLDAMPLLPTMADLTQRANLCPQLLRAQIEVERRKAITDAERARRIPDITVSLGNKRDEQLGRNQAIVGVSIPLPLFDRNQGNLQEAYSRTDKARDELALTETRLTSELAQAQQRLSAALQEVRLLQRDILPGAQSVYDASAKGFEYGKFDFLNVLDSLRTLLLAKSHYLRALSDAHRAAVEIERILGPMAM